MLFFEQYARFGAIFHAILGAALVAASTHLVLWMRRYPSGKYTRVASVRRFALITLALYASTFLLGNLLYPTYKVRIRAEYLDDGSAVVRDLAARVNNTEATRRRYAQSRALANGIDSKMSERPVPRDQAQAARSAKKVARWFDVKEHWTALGLILSLACVLVLRGWRPTEQPRAVPMLALGLAVGIALISWSAAIIGLVVSSFRAVG